MTVAMASAAAVSIARFVAVRVAGVDDIQCAGLVPGGRCVARLEIAYIERVQEYAVQRVQWGGYRARVVGARRWCYERRINERQIIFEHFQMQFIVHAHYSDCNLNVRKEGRNGSSWVFSSFLLLIIISFFLL